MEDKELLLKYEKRYKKLQMSCNNGRAADLALNEVFGHLFIKPYIYSDEMGDPLYLLHVNYCYIFGYGIYKKD